MLTLEAGSITQSHTQSFIFKNEISSIGVASGEMKKTRVVEGGKEEEEKNEMTDSEFFAGDVWFLYLMSNTRWSARVNILCYVRTCTWGFKGYLTSVEMN